MNFNMEDKKNVERLYFEGIGAIKQRIVFYFEQSDYFSHFEGVGSFKTQFFSHKAQALQEALNILEEGL